MKKKICTTNEILWSWINVETKKFFVTNINSFIFHLADVEAKIKFVKHEVWNNEESCLDEFCGVELVVQCRRTQRWERVIKEAKRNVTTTHKRYGSKRVTTTHYFICFMDLFFFSSKESFMNILVLLFKINCLRNFGRYYSQLLRQ